MDPFPKWKKDRKTTIKELRRLARIINTHANNSKIASLVGTGTSILTGVGAAVCYFAIPFTSGASLIPAFALTGVSIAGTATSLGSSFTNYLIEKGYMKDVKEAINKERESYESLKKLFEEAKKIKLAKGFEYANTFGKSIPVTIRSGAKVGSIIAEKLSLSEKAVATLIKLTRTAHVAGNILTIVTLPLDIVFFVKDAIDLAKGNVSAAADAILKLATQLEDNLKDVSENEEETAF